MAYTYVCTRCVLRPTAQHFLSSRHIRRSCIGSEVALASIDAPPLSTVVVVVVYVVGGGCRCVDRRLLMKMMTSLWMNHYRCLPLNRVEKNENENTQVNVIDKGPHPSTEHFKSVSRSDPQVISKWFPSDS